VACVKRNSRLLASADNDNAAAVAAAAVAGAAAAAAAAAVAADTAIYIFRGQNTADLPVRMIRGTRTRTRTRRRDTPMALSRDFVIVVSFGALSLPTDASLFAIFERIFANAPPPHESLRTCFVCATHAHSHFCPQHWLLCHLDLY